MTQLALAQSQVFQRSKQLESLSVRLRANNEEYLLKNGRHERFGDRHAPVEPLHPFRQRPPRIIEVGLAVDAARHHRCGECRQLRYFV